MNFLLEPWNKDINAKKIVGLLAHYCLERYIRKYVCNNLDYSLLVQLIVKKHSKGNQSVRGTLYSKSPAIFTKFDDSFALPSFNVQLKLYQALPLP